MGMAEIGAHDGITMSARAARRISEIVTEGHERDTMLRVAVGGGGCSGFQYSFTFDDATNDDDRVIERDDARIVIDEISWDYIGGAEIDYVEELIGAFFTIRNPNATSTCGCGTSFAVE
jgi:iron-sulfur cluster insertion protein